MLWSAAARRARTPLLVGTGPRAALTLRCFRTATSTGGDGHDRRQSAPQDKILQALQAYKKLEGDTLVPNAFVVPRDDDHWPKLAWGYRLGRGVSYLRTQLQRGENSMMPAEFRRELEKLGFVQDVLRYQWNTVIMPAFRRYYEINGDLDVPRKFVVPRGDATWPNASWGLKLGFTVNNIRNSDRYADEVAEDSGELERMGFCFTTIAERDWKEGVLPALETYHREFGDCIVRQSFVVPSGFPWPEKTWELKLGQKLVDMRAKGTFFAHFGRDAGWLDTLGFNMRLSADAFEKRVTPLIELYATVTGSQDIPDDFVIPSEAPWPEAMWGVHLGLIVARNSHHLR